MEVRDAGLQAADWSSISQLLTDSWQSLHQQVNHY
jgi:hypothetical protein